MSGPCQGGVRAPDSPDSLSGPCQEESGRQGLVRNSPCPECISLVLLVAAIGARCVFGQSGLAACLVLALQREVNLVARNDWAERGGRVGLVPILSTATSAGDSRLYTCAPMFAVQDDFIRVHW